MRQSPVGTIYLLKRAEMAVRARMEVALERFGLTPGQFLILALLRDRAELCSAELARETGVRPQSVTEIVIVLERRELLERRTHPSRPRALCAHLTAAGQRLLTEASAVAAQIEAELIADFTEADAARLQSLLTAVLHRCEKHGRRHTGRS